MVLQAHPGNVDSVLVAGKFVKRDGHLVADLAGAVTMIGDAQQHVAREVEKLGGFKPISETGNSSSIPTKIT